MDPFLKGHGDSRRLLYGAGFFGTCRPFRSTKLEGPPSEARNARITGKGRPRKKKKTRVRSSPWSLHDPLKMGSLPKIMGSWTHF